MTLLAAGSWTPVGRHHDWTVQVTMSVAIRHLTPLRRLRRATIDDQRSRRAPERTGHARAALATAAAAGLLMLWAGSRSWRARRAWWTPPAFPPVLRTQLQFSNSELSALTRGQPVVKTLPADHQSGDDHGRRRAHPQRRHVAFRRPVQRRSRDSRPASSCCRFTNSATRRSWGELDALIVDAEDVESLRECRVGACDVQLAADDIGRLQADVNWRSPTAVRRRHRAVQSHPLCAPDQVPDRRQRSARPLSGSRDRRFDWRPKPPRFSTRSRRCWTRSRRYRIIFDTTPLERPGLPRIFSTGPRRCSASSR